MSESDYLEVLECGSCKFYRGDRYGIGTCTKKEKEVKNNEYGKESCEHFKLGGLRRVEKELNEILEKHRKAEFNAKVLENGRITIPSVERDLNNIKEGDYVSVTVKKIQEKEGTE